MDGTDEIDIYLDETGGNDAASDIGEVDGQAEHRVMCEEADDESV